MNTSREETFIRTFIQPQKRERYLQLLANPKRRSKALNAFYHTLETLEERTARIANRDNYTEDVERLLRQKGAGPTCYILSPEPNIDQQEMPLREALESIIDQDRVAVVCCLPGRLAYYKAELSAYLLENRPFV